MTARADVEHKFCNAEAAGYQPGMAQSADEPGDSLSPVDPENRQEGADCRRNRHCEKKSGGTSREHDHEGGNYGSGRPRLP